MSSCTSKHGENNRVRQAGANLGLGSLNGRREHLCEGGWSDTRRKSF